MFRRIKFAWMTLATLLLFTAAGMAVAKTDTGSIAGTVTDPTGAVIPGAKVVATSTDTGLKLNAVSNGTGGFSILAVPRGNYTVVASSTGFQSAMAHVTVIVTTTQTVAFQLKPAGSSTTVQVTEEVPLVNASDATIGATIMGKQVTDLPLNGRNFTNLAL